VDEATKAEVARLLKRGLNHYGLGDLDAAIACWEKARALDPSNKPVQDYLETAYEEADKTPRSLDRIADTAAASAKGAPPEPGPPEAEGSDATVRSLPRVPAPAAAPAKGRKTALPDDGERDPDTLVRGALENFRAGRLHDAWSELDRVARENPDRLDVRGYQELVRKEMMEHWAREIGDRGRTLVRIANDQQLMGKNLRPDEAFLLSQIDGMITIDDLISLSSAGRFRTFEILVRLLRDRIVE
jgi:tetratricopeptide (TPR) repeat protein